MGPYFYEEAAPIGLGTCSIKSDGLANMLENFVISQLQQRNCIYFAIFPQDGAAAYIGASKIPYESLRFLVVGILEKRCVSRICS
ncbi:hypothetical protein NPIL_72831 [Nephila pilipes]|uniref:Uncharacterized protein n=1 Tax=Nephila pilipes TaxID=299642 RepID=A0A8X6UB80_NEPPI|nr:hypothetical protein NPIL_72831 [Nephila pilipes]